MHSPRDRRFDKACGPKTPAPYGLRRHGAICGETSDGEHRRRRAALQLAPSRS